MGSVTGDEKQYQNIKIHALHKKWSFKLRISSVNVTKSTAYCGFGPI